MPRLFSPLFPEGFGGASCGFLAKPAPSSRSNWAVQSRVSFSHKSGSRGIQPISKRTDIMASMGPCTLRHRSCAGALVNWSCASRQPCRSHCLSSPSSAEAFQMYIQTSTCSMGRGTSGGQLSPSFVTKVEWVQGWHPYAPHGCHRLPCCRFPL